MGAELIPRYHPLGFTTWAKNVESCRDMIRAASGRTSVAELLLLITPPWSGRTPQVSPSRNKGALVRSMPGM